MGIDIYARWKSVSKAEKAKQYDAGFNILGGDVGYLREAYHGEPYATKCFVKEAFENKNHKAKIPAEVLFKRLPKTLKLAREREKKLYRGNEYCVFLAQQSFVDFYKLCREKEDKTGKPCTIIASY
jgi:hypothetical protein